MPQYITTASINVKEGMLEAAKTEMQRWMEGFKGVGAEFSVYTQVGGGSTDGAMVAIEFPDGDTWLKSIEDPRLLAARERMTEADWPFHPAASTVWQRIELDD